ncbi:hypothetical protein J2T09_005406 [Neorhizobium huautlense]|uniref:Uncharacterized protein n=1 Tax=Neorhizobium huautlense TaxID=67774 RepID=A0ABT9Q2Q4_9HYPH|nr:hypothetical protein [Neorhizobium huautlense]MDP9840618.1 hypothetical protein [Neorhizobium huautlense]
MSEQIPLATGDQIQPGEIRFSEAALMPLSAGTYRLSARQEVVLQQEDDTPTYLAQQQFVIDGPRFSLAPSDVQMVMPPSAQAGDWENWMPNIVLRRRIIPWVRTIDGSSRPPDAVSTPWIGLLVVTDTELGGAAGAIQAPSPVVTGTVADLLQTGKASIAGPQLANVSADEQKAPLLYLDLDAALFQGIAPTLTDLTFLAHVRDVNTDSKEILGLDEDGSFSVVVGNRTIQTSGREDVVNYCFLVSLEGHQNHLPGNAVPPGVKTFRFASLAWWKVQALPARGDFIEIMQDLPGLGGDALIGMPHAAIAGMDDNSRTAAAGLGMGYTPLTYRMRAGENVTAWYRGPIASVPTGNDGLGAFPSSDLAIRYDPKTALFDLSQAAAWQIGLLLGLSDSSFARQLFEWRRATHASVRNTVNLNALVQQLPETGVSYGKARAVSSASQGQRLARFAATTALSSALIGEGVEKRRPTDRLPKRVRREERTVEGTPGTGLAAQPAGGAASDSLDNLLDRVFGPMDIVE